MKFKKQFILLLGGLTLITAVCVSCKSEEEGPSLPPEDKEEQAYYTLRVLTYNIFHGETTNGEIDMDLFADIINNASPDLVALQEVDKGVERSGRIDITAELSERTGLSGHFGKYRAFQGGDYGAAILSKLPIVNFEVRPGYRTGSHGVAMLYAKVEIAENIYIYFNSSHLSTNDEERIVHTEQLASYYESTIDKAPLLICGDLNAEPASPEMDVLWEHFAESDSTFANTFSTRTGMRKKIDYILYPDNENWEVVETKRICRVDASDHCAFLSVLKFKKK